MSKSPITVFLEESWENNIKSVHTHPHCLEFFTHLSPHLVLYGLVDPVDQPGEGLSIDGFGQGIPGIDGMIDCEWAEDLYSKTKS